jgi:hypothetical protein
MDVPGGSAPGVPYTLNPSLHQTPGEIFVEKCSPYILSRREIEDFNNTGKIIKKALLNSSDSLLRGKL